MLIVSSDGPVVGRLDIEIRSKGEALLSNRYRVPAEVQLPATVAIVSNGNATAQAQISVTAWRVSPGLADVPLDRRAAIVTQIPTDRVAVLTVVLNARCSDKLTVDGDGNAQCGNEQACDERGACVAAATVVASSLPTYQPGDENDAGFAGSAGASGASGASAEAGEAGEAGARSDPCTGKVCNAPPENDCQSASKLLAYDGTGSCSAGECQYTSRLISCVCEDRECATDPCDTVVCNDPPAANCKTANTLTTYAATGSCSRGTCSYIPTDRPCDFGCSKAACNPDPCSSVKCETPPTATCKDVNTATTYAAPGTCSAGSCSYKPTSVPCGSNQTCGGNGVCSLCKSDASCGASCAACSGATPKCRDLGSSSKCVGCLADADCGLGVKCELSTNTCVVPLSCAGLAATCGPNGNANCCASNVVKGELFYRGNDTNYPATLSDFRLDTYEISVGRFQKFLAVYAPTMIAQGAGKNPNNPSDPGWDTAWNSSLLANSAAVTSALQCATGYNTLTAGKPNLPINCLNWFEAEAFCIWDGGRLPTEAESNFAAAGGSDQRLYPWGASVPGPDADLVVYGCYFMGMGTCTGVTNIAPVGSVSAGNGKFGQADLAGNMLEWLQDWNAAYTAQPCNNCANLTPSSSRGFRDGSFQYSAFYLTSAYRNSYPPTSRYRDTGARCARAR
ncbi:MAG: SUMF1/EgtB/PvdO family nonheme iron enzyme [Pseudomonadota bacterium]